jgi:hypothetical protein
MNRSLVLNAPSEPLGVEPTRRAVLLVLTGKASTLADSGTKCHSRSIVVDAEGRSRYVRARLCVLQQVRRHLGPRSSAFA